MQELHDRGAIKLPAPPKTRRVRLSTRFQGDRGTTTRPSRRASSKAGVRSAATSAVGATDAQASNDGDDSQQGQLQQSGAGAQQLDSPATLQHSLFDAEVPFAPVRPLPAQPMLWNALACQRPDGLPQPLPPSHVPAAPSTHRHGCLPALLLLACPSVAAVYLAQATAPPPRSNAAAKAAPQPPAPPIPGISAIEAALLAEAATSPAWHLGPTDPDMVCRQCDITSRSLGLGAAVPLQLHVRSAMSVYFAAQRLYLHVDDAVGDATAAEHALSLQLASSRVTTYDLPAVLYVLACPVDTLWPLLDTSPLATGVASVAEGGPEGGQGRTRGASVHKSRGARLSVAAGLFDSGMHELPAWLELASNDQLPSLMLLPVNPDGAQLRSLSAFRAAGVGFDSPLLDQATTYSMPQQAFADQ